MPVLKFYFQPFGLPWVIRAPALIFFSGCIHLCYLTHSWMFRPAPSIAGSPNGTDSLWRALAMAHHCRVSLSPGRPHGSSFHSAQVISSSVKLLTSYAWNPYRNPDPYNEIVYCISIITIFYSELKKIIIINTFIIELDCK